MNTNAGKVTNEKTTIYLDPRVKKSVRYYAVRDDKSLSEIINAQLLEYLEEQDDARTIEDARAHAEEFVSIEEVVKDLGLDIDEIRSRAAAEHKKATKKN